MGQYHLVVNLDKREYIYPHRMDHPSPITALGFLLACSNGRGGGDLPHSPLIGRWAGDRIAIVSDYAAIYSRCSNGEFRDISEECLAFLIECDL